MEKINGLDSIESKNAEIIGSSPITPRAKESGVCAASVAQNGAGLIESSGVCGAAKSGATLSLQKRGEAWEIVEKIGKKRGRRVLINLAQNESEKAWILFHLQELFKNGAKSEILKKHKEHNKTILLAKKELASVERICADFLAQKQSEDLRSNTKRTYKSQIAVLLDFFKAQNIEFISDCNSKTSSELLSYLKANRGNKSAQCSKILSTFKMLVEYAVENEIIYNNFYKKPRGFKREQREPTPLKWNSAKELMKAAKGALKLYLHLAFYTGARESEILALKWCDIDLDSELLSINKIMLPNGEIQNETKTKTSTREVQIIKPLLEYLKGFKEIKAAQNSYIFSDIKGNVLKAQKLRQMWGDLIAQNENLESDIKSRRLYDTRATFASNCLSNNEPIVWVSKMLGHANASITLKHYARFIPCVKHNIGDWI